MTVYTTKELFGVADLEDEVPDDPAPHPRLEHHIDLHCIPECPGLWILPNHVSPREQSDILDQLRRHYPALWTGGGHVDNQVMLFEPNDQDACSDTTSDKRHPSKAPTPLTLLPQALKERLALIYRQIHPITSHDKSKRHKDTWQEADEQIIHGRHGRPFNQAIINAYAKGGSLPLHVDLTPRFADTILSISLVSPCTFCLARDPCRPSSAVHRSVRSRSTNIFRHYVYKEKVQEGHTSGQEGDEVWLWLRPGDILVMTGEARYIWRHGIDPWKTRHFARRFLSTDCETAATPRDAMPGFRISMTFRHIPKDQRALFISHENETIK